MRIRMTDAFVTMRYDDRTEEDGMAIWKGTYDRPIGIVGPFHLAGTLETADCSGDTGTRLDFDINDPTPGIHTVSAVVKNDETMTKTTFVPAEPASLVATVEEPSFFSKPITYLLKHLFGVSKKETEDTENAIPIETEAEPVYAPLEEPELTAPEARKLCKKPPEPTFVCGSSSVLDADNNSYGTVPVGTQCWMDKNMNVGTRIASTVSQTDNSIIEKYCYNNEEGLCGAEGGLYQWNETMQYSTDEGAQGICPAGWHIPTDAEQYALENYLKDDGQTCDAARNGMFDCASAGTKLKSGGSSGLNIPLAGGCSGAGTPCSSRTTNTRLWSSLQSGGNAWRRSMDFDRASVDRLPAPKSLGFSVRCLKD